MIRAHLLDAAVARMLPCAIDLLPIVEDGLFGYELVPDRETHTYLIVGSNAEGTPILRQITYGVGAPGMLRLAAVNGHHVSRSERAARFSTSVRDEPFSNWFDAAESAWVQLLRLFPKTLRQPEAPRNDLHGFEEALATAHLHLIRWDPFIQFFGLPNEAQLGYALTGTNGEHGTLTFEQPDTWSLHWTTATEVLYESWATVTDDLDPSSKTASDVHFPNRRAHFRRATDAGRPPLPWVGIDRRQTRGRRIMDQPGS